MHVTHQQCISFWDNAIFQTIDLKQHIYTDGETPAAHFTQFCVMASFLAINVEVKGKRECREYLGIT